jgi:hypothetical protein
VTTIEQNEQAPATEVSPGPLGHITITHTYADGSLLHGTSRAEGQKGHPVREVIDRYGWRWSRQCGWYQRGSRDQPHRKYQLAGTAEDLRKLGYEVDDSGVDDTPRDMATQEADREQRMEDRADALFDKADRRFTESTSRQNTAMDQLGWEPGQPKIGSPRVRRQMDRAIEKHDHNMRRSIDLEEEGSRIEERGRAAARHMQRRYDPVTVANRITTLEATVRKADRGIGDPRGKYQAVSYDADGKAVWVDREHSETHLKQWDQIRADAVNKLEWWRQVRAQQIADGVTTAFSRDTVAVGDWVFGWPGGPNRVCRVNSTTVTIETMRSRVEPYDWLTNKLKYHEIRRLISAQEWAEREEAKRIAALSPEEAAAEIARRDAEVEQAATEPAPEPKPAGRKRGRRVYSEEEKEAFRAADTALKKAADALLADPVAVTDMVTSMLAGINSARVLRFSLRNQAILLKQAEERGMVLLDVRSAQDWAMVGRSMRPGEVGFRVVRPIGSEVDDTGETDTTSKAEQPKPDGEPPKERALFRMTQRKFFDLSQTEGAELVVRGDQEETLWQNLAAQLARRGFRVVDDDQPRERTVDRDEKVVWVSPSAPPAVQVVTLALGLAEIMTASNEGRKVDPAPETPQVNEVAADGDRLAS